MDKDFRDWLVNALIHKSVGLSEISENKFLKFISRYHEKRFGWVVLWISKITVVGNESESYDG